ncbi:MAG: hypothetical protein KC656_05390 [Myxococcales bacterium]|nr:hypothetical protein [Myxococcales bacterium]MCB9669940.1 hypothetical protein [Alphaproteobacteria bacterium]MCB9693186.1 hypothetical protein [Alphaproteobacteria bacterium]
MGSKADQRAQKKREKQKKKRAEASRARASRAPVVPASRSGRPDLSAAAGWPLGECYLSETWSEHGPRVEAGFVRQHAGGRCAAVFFAADLRDGGVSDVLAAADVSSDAVTGEVARRSERAGHALHLAEGDLVARVLHTALELGDTNGVERPAGIADALELMGEVDGSTSPFTLLTGPPPPPPPKKKTLLGWIFGDG